MIEVNSQIIFSPLHYISIAEHQNKVARQIRKKIMEQLTLTKLHNLSINTQNNLFDFVCICDQGQQTTPPSYRSAECSGRCWCRLGIERSNCRVAATAGLNKTGILVLTPAPCWHLLRIWIWPHEFFVTKPRVFSSPVAHRLRLCSRFATLEQFHD